MAETSHGGGRFQDIVLHYLIALYTFVDVISFFLVFCYGLFARSMESRTAGVGVRERDNGQGGSFGKLTLKTIISQGRIDQNLWSPRVFFLTHSHLAMGQNSYSTLWNLSID